METKPFFNVAATTGGVIEKTLYTGKVHITGGREGAAKSSDGHLDIKLSTPGGAGTGTNPEQLLAAGWSACFIGAMRHNATSLQIALPVDTVVDTEIDLGTGSDGFHLQARMTVSLPGLTEDDAKLVIEAAHQTCPYSKATRGNIKVTFSYAV
jgi:osmotically inducible protein OsmC